MGVSKEGKKIHFLIKNISLYTCSRSAILDIRNNVGSLVNKNRYAEDHSNNIDRINGFKWGGWQFSYSDQIAENAIVELMSAPFDLLLGHRTYEIFASYWPHHDKDLIGEKFNRINKYVVATTPIVTPWKNSTVISKDVVNELRKLKSKMHRIFWCMEVAG